MLPAAVALAVVAAVRLRGRALAAFFGVAAGPAAAGFLAYYRAIFGVASPLAIYGGVPPGRGRLARCAPWPGSLSTARSGCCRTRRSSGRPGRAAAALARRARLGMAASLAAAVVAPGRCPGGCGGAGSARPRASWCRCVPVLALALAARVAAVAHGARALALAAGARWASPTTIGMTVRPGALLLLNRGDRPTRLWAALSGRAAGRDLPAVAGLGVDRTSGASPSSGWSRSRVLLALDAWARRRDRIDRLFRDWGCPIVLMLCIGVAVDTWARGRLSTRPTAHEPGRASTRRSEPAGMQRP